MKIVITGSTGLVGAKLVEFFKTGGHEVYQVSRRRGTSYITWDPSVGDLDRQALEGTDVLIHLAGANLSEKRWTRAYKKIILDSRVQSSRFLMDNILLLKNKPKLVISASAIGYYGHGSMRETKNESSLKGPGFLAEVCDQWEEQVRSVASSQKIRAVQMRFGLILAKNKGALAAMLPIFNLGLGGRLGHGQQPLSWISIEEIPAIVDFIMKDNSIFGPVNVVTPHPVTNEEFTRSLCAVLRRPRFLPVPALAVKILFGQMGDDLLLNGVNVFPNVLVRHEYEFKYPHLTQALEKILS